MYCPPIKRCGSLGNDDAEQVHTSEMNWVRAAASICQAGDCPVPLELEGGDALQVGRLLEENPGFQVALQVVANRRLEGGLDLAAQRGLQTQAR